MIGETLKVYNKQIYYRLTALWVICEAFAGGIMHAVKVPFAGMIISSLAIMCIILIAWYVPATTAIIKATIIVAIFKLMLSPHSPPPAYIAVFFQGLLGQLLFLNRRFFTASAILLAVLSLVESAIQRILVLIILYGNNFWKAVNEFLQNLTKQKSATNYSLAIAIIYISVHALVGFFVGLYASRLAKQSAGWYLQYPEYLIKKGSSEISKNKNNGRRKKIRIVFIIIWIILAAMFIQSLVDPKHAVMPSNIVIQVIVRASLITLSWYLLLSPLILIVLKKLLQQEQLKKQQQVNEVLLLLPGTKYIFVESWHLAAAKKGFGRIKLFLKILLTNILAGENNDPVKQ